MRGAAGSPTRISMQEVFPPKTTVSGPGQGMEPRSPQMVTWNMLSLPPGLCLAIRPKTLGLKAPR